MAKNENGYVQVFIGPDGEPMVVLHGSDFTLLLQKAFAAEQRRKKPKFMVSRSPVGLDDSKKAAAWFSDYISDIRNYRADTILDSFADEEVYDQTRAALDTSREEIVPAVIANRLIDGENPVAVWRDYRGLTQKALAQAAELTQPMISQIEAGKRTGDIDTLKAIADALTVTIDDLVA